MKFFDTPSADAVYDANDEHLAKASKLQGNSDGEDFDC